jgi:hypothetical protein
MRKHFVGCALCRPRPDGYPTTSPRPGRTLTAAPLQERSERFARVLGVALHICVAGRVSADGGP